MHSPHNHPDIKIGEIYNLRIHVVGKSEDFIIARPITQNGGYATSSFLEILHKYAPSFTPIHSEHGTSVPTTPCQFKEGDRVQARKIHGNLPQCRYNGNVGIKEGDIGTIEKYNERNCYWVDFHKGMSWCIDVAYLELVTPVEELEPYSIDPANTNVLFKRGKKFATFEDDDEAQELCDRLNAEYRKEQNK